MKTTNELTIHGKDGQPFSDALNEVNLIVGKNNSGKSLLLTKICTMLLVKYRDVQTVGQVDFTFDINKFLALRLRFKRNTKTEDDIKCDIKTIFDDDIELKTDERIVHIVENYNEMFVNPSPYISSTVEKIVSFLIHLNHKLSENVTHIIIDDFCEGLDWNYSIKMTELLLNKIKKYPNIQWFISTNNQFVIDTFPLKNIIVIHRKGTNFLVYSYKNNKEIFDKFKFTGLGNYDILTSNYYLK
jgi:predicted ATP-dependent endonuclease of OLD family